MYHKRIGRSTRGKKLDAMDKVMSKIIQIKRGRKCEVCGRTNNLGVSHILPKSIYPRLRYHEFNLILLDWTKCHSNLHHYTDHDPPNRHTIEKIKELRGEDYRDQLLAINRMQPQMTAFRLDLIHRALIEELQSLEGK